MGKADLRTLKPLIAGILLPACLAFFSPPEKSFATPLPNKHCTPLRLQRVFERLRVSKRAEISPEQLRLRDFHLGRKNIQTYPATGAYVHQVLGLKFGSAINSAEWMRWFDRLLTRSAAPLVELENQWLTTSFENVIWTTKDRLYTREDLTSIQVTMKFKKNYVFVNRYALPRLWDREQSPVRLGKKYFVVGEYDLRNNFHKIFNFEGLESIEVVDPVTKERKKYSF